VGRKVGKIHPTSEKSSSYGLSSPTVVGFTLRLITLTRGIADLQTTAGRLVNAHARPRGSHRTATNSS